jgi:hypothetical protein
MRKCEKVNSKILKRHAENSLKIDQNPFFSPQLNLVTSLDQDMLDLCGILNFLVTLDLRKALTFLR